MLNGESESNGMKNKEKKKRKKKPSAKHRQKIIVSPFSFSFYISSLHGQNLAEPRRRNGMQTVFKQARYRNRSLPHGCLIRGTS